MATSASSKPFPRPDLMNSQMLATLETVIMKRRRKRTRERASTESLLCSGFCAINDDDDGLTGVVRPRASCVAVTNVVAGCGQRELCHRGDLSFR